MQFLLLLVSCYQSNSRKYTKIYQVYSNMRDQSGLAMGIRILMSECYFGKFLFSRPLPSIGGADVVTLSEV